MPRLMLFAIAEKVIRDTDDESMSLISMLMSIRPIIGKDELPLYENTVSPLTWEAGALWKKMPGDEGKKYESRIDIIKPDGEPIGGSEFSFVMQKQFRITQIKGTHFPIGIEGVHTARIAIREVDGEWEIVGTYPVDVEYDLSESENDDAPDKEVKDDV